MKNSIKSNIDGCSNVEISGWIIDIDNPLQAMKVDIFIDEELISHTTANLFRQDLFDAKLGNGNCAFQVSIPDKFFDGVEHIVIAYEVETKAVLHGGSKTFKLFPKVRGTIDRCDEIGICGWVVNDTNPQQPVNIDIFIDDELINHTTANLFRQDLFDAKLGNGNCAFKVPIPDKFWDGVEHSVNIQESVTITVLQGSPKTFKLSPKLEQQNSSLSVVAPAIATPKIAVVVHVYYLEIWTEIAQFLKAITHPFDLFVTTTTEQVGTVGPAVTADFPKVRLYIQPNNGMDVLPFLALIPLLVTAGYLAVCKLHTKRGDGGEEGASYRRALLHPLIGDDATFTAVVQAFVQHDDLQLVGPASLYLSARKLMLNNEANVKFLYEQLENRPLPVEDWGFFAGSMLWLRPTAVQKLAQAVAYLSDQHSTEYQADGQVSHAIERLLGLVSGLNQGQVGLLHSAVASSAKRYVLQIVAANMQINQAEISDVLRQYVNLEHYLAQNPGLVGLEVDLLVHYLLVGRFGTLFNEHVICNKNDDGLSINLIGHASSPLGLGEDLRQVAFALLDHGIPFSIIDIPTEQTDPIPKSLQPYVTLQATHPISLFCVSPFTYAELVQDDPQRFADHYRIGNFLWELEHFPSAWAYILNQVHEIWAPTRFVQDIYTRAGCLNVFKIPTPATPPVRREGSLRKRLGLSSSVFVFGFMFDLHSVIKRKNPAGLISAYLRMKSLQPTRETALLIKVHRSNFYSEELVALKASCANHRNIHFFEETLPAHEVVLFYNTIDAYVSLHRSEGLGRTLIEAAQLGLPVICTKYSGSSDIVALGAALGVESQLIPCQPGEYPNCEGSVWAEPDLNQAAELMVKVMQDKSAYLPNVQSINNHFSKKYFLSNLQDRICTIYTKKLKTNYCDTNRRLLIDKINIDFILAIVQKYKLFRFIQLDDVQIFNNELLLNYPKNWDAILWADSKYWPRLSRHAAYTILQYRLRSSSFFCNRINEVDSMESILWYLFEFDDNRFLEKRLGPTGNTFLKAIGGSHISPTVPPLYYLWKYLYLKNQYPVTQIELIQSYLLDRSDFELFCYKKSISESLFLMDDRLKEKNYSSKKESQKWLSTFGESALMARHDVYNNSDLECCIALLFDLVIHNPCNPTYLRALGPKLNQLMRLQVHYQDNQTATLFEYLSYFVMVAKKNKNTIILPKIIDTNFIKKWFINSWCQAFPSSALYASPCAKLFNSSNQDNIVVAIYAKWNSESGLTRNAIMSEQALQSVGIKTMRVPLEKSIVEKITDISVDNNLQYITQYITLIHLNADDAVEGLFNLYSVCSNITPLKNFGFFLWEVSTTPPIHELGVHLVDEVLVPTEYIKEVYSHDYEDIIVKNIGKYVILPSRRSLPSYLAGYMQDKFVFFTAFDAGSGVERKNPMALVTAYMQAFSQDHGAILIIKGGKISDRHWGDPFNMYQHIEEYVRTRSDIFLLNEYLSDEDLHGLISSSHCIVSTHRAEGFGYLMAYALLYGKPLIYTDYSGIDKNLLNIETALPVKYRLISTPNNKFFHDGFDMKWADVDVIELTGLLKKVKDRAVSSTTDNSNITEYFSCSEYSKRLLNVLNFNKILN